MKLQLQFSTIAAAAVLSLSSAVAWAHFGIVIPEHSAVMAALLMACCSAQAQNARMDEDPASDDAIELKTTYVLSLIHI